MPAAPRITDTLTVTLAARSAAPAGYHYKVFALKRSIISESCSRFAFQDLNASGAAQSVTFTPQSAALPIGGSSIWCGGLWSATINLVPDSGDAVGQVIDFVEFTIAF